MTLEQELRGLHFADTSPLPNTESLSLLICKPQPFTSQSSINNTLNNTQVLLTLLPNPLNLQANLRRQLPPLLLRPFQRGMDPHHVNVGADAEHARVAVRDDQVVDEEAGVARRHGGDELGEYLEGVAVFPIVEYVTEEVEFRV